jgi:hypothetical protein
VLIVVIVEILEVVVELDVVVVVAVAALNAAIQPAHCAELAVVPLSAVPADETIFSRYAALIR